MNSYKILIISFLSVFFLASCEDVIELDLENTDPQLVIEGTIDMTAQTARVSATQTNDFYDAAEPVFVENAMAELTSENGNTYTLTEIEPGIFEVENLTILPEEKFTLAVEANGERYEAEAIAPFPAALQGIEADKFTAPFGNSDEIRYRVFTNWIDEAGVENFYRIRAYQNEEFLASNYMVLSDELLDGRPFNLPVRQGIFEEGETVRVELMSTSEKYYDYFLELQGLSPDGGGITPYNPKGNFDNGAFGYFGIYSVSTMKLEL